MSVSKWLRTGASSLLLALPVLTACANHHEKASPASADRSASHSAKAGAGSADCQSFMERQERLNASMREMNERLDRLVAEMNKATGERRVETMAAVLNEMIAQRKSLQTSMAEMRAGMMGHMAGHMAAMMRAADGAIIECPMMKGMTTTAESQSSRMGGATDPASNRRESSKRHAGMAGYYEYLGYH